MKSLTQNAIKTIATIGLLFTGCAKPTSGVQHQIAVQFGSYTTAGTKIKRNNLLRLFLPEAQAAVSNLKLCFKRLRFKMADEVTNPDPTLDSDNIDFSLGEIDISAGSTALGVISLPAGNYKRVEFDLENSCASGKSMSLVNTNGSYTSTERVTIKFEGDFSANADGTLTLGVQQILTQLNSYDGLSASLKVSAEAISGVLNN